LWIEDGTIPKYFRKTRLKCDIRDCFSALGLQLLAAVLQPCLPDVIADGHAPVAEQHVQIAFGAAQCRRNLVDAEIRVAQVFADEGLGAHIHRHRTTAVERRAGFAKRQ
jgi:hypothetical protein